ncbi:MAG TPA: ATP synthase F1 subunit delta [Oculatellaceae cyanobacterium]
MKTETSTVAAQYADAILQLADQVGGQLADTVMQDLNLASETFKTSPELTLILEHPSIPTEEKRKVLVELFDGRCQDLTLRLLELLLDKRRITLVPAITREYHSLLNAKKNIVSASLVCADKLSDTALADIKARLAEHVGSHLELEVKVDPSLLGGVVLKLGDQVIDGSLKGKLANMERILLSV